MKQKSSTLAIWTSSGPQADLDLGWLRSAKMGIGMSELDRLIEIAQVLPAEKVHALLTVAEQMTDYVSDEEFLRKINSPVPVDVDEETAAELRSALSERGETISHEELKRRLMDEA